MVDVFSRSRAATVDDPAVAAGNSSAAAADDVPAAAAKEAEEEEAGEISGETPSPPLSPARNAASTVEVGATNSSVCSSERRGMRARVTGFKNC